MQIRTVPVIIDDIKQHRNFKITRCNYFSIESDEPGAGWELHLGDNNTIPFLMIGLQGVIFSAINDSGIFRNPDDIEALFDLIEEQSGHLYIDINHLWIPNFLFNRNHIIGQTLRITLPLFNLSYRFNQHQLTTSEFIRDCKELEDPVVYEHSETETQAFDKWSENHIDEAKINYRENEEMALKYSDES